MGSKVYLFNLPPIKTCTPTAWCLKGKNGKPACYALRNNFLLSNVVEGFRYRYLNSKKDNFVDRMISEIQRTNVEFFRFHSSGDFYSEKYVKKVIEIVHNCPNTLFRSTTRRRDLTKIIQELNSLPNMIVRESLDSERREPKMGLPFAALDDLLIVQEQNPYKCKNSCPVCDYYCWKHPINTCFKQH